MLESQESSLSICIVNYNSTLNDLRSVISSLLRSIRKLQRALPQSFIKFYLVNNSEDSKSSANVLAEFAFEFENFGIISNLIQGHGNIGFGKGHNLVILNLESTYHLILNPDVILDENCLTEGIGFLAKHPETAILSPYATGKNDQKQYLCKTYPALFTFLVRGFAPSAIKVLFRNRLAKFEMRDLSESEPGAGIPIVSGCFMLCRTNSLQEVQGFDENYFLYFEDFDLSLRVSRLADITYLPGMKIKHAGGHAARKGIRHLFMFVKSGCYFFNTHGWRLFRQS